MALLSANLVSQSTHGVDESITQFFANVVNMHFQGVAVYLLVPGVQTVEQAVAGHWPTPVYQKGLQQGEFLG